MGVRGFENDAEVWRQAGLLTLEKRLLPDTGRPAVLVIAGDRKHRDAEASDGTACGRDRRFGHSGRIEKIARDENELSPMLLGCLADSLKHVETILLH